MSYLKDYRWRCAKCGEVNLDSVATCAKCGCDDGREEVICRVCGESVPIDEFNDEFRMCDKCYMHGIRQIDHTVENDMGRTASAVWRGILRKFCL